MGPRFCKRGNVAAFLVADAEHQLQWGHAFVSVETFPQHIKHAPTAWLQWGHAFVSVETNRLCASLTSGDGFNGATLL